MIKKFLALSLAVLAMASHMTTENKVIGKIYPDPNSSNDRTFYASTKADERCNYISAQIFLGDAENNADIATYKANGHNLDYVDVPAHVTGSNPAYVRVTGIHQVSSSDNNITSDFGVCNIYRQ